MERERNYYLQVERDKQTAPFINLFLDQSKFKFDQVLVEIYLSFCKLDIIMDVGTKILDFLLYLYDSHAMSDMRTILPSRYPILGKKDCYFQGYQCNFSDYLLSQQIVEEAGSMTFGSDPIHFFTLESSYHMNCHMSYEKFVNRKYENFGQNCHVLQGKVNRFSSLCFAINKKDNGIKARVTFGIPSAFRNVNYLEACTKIIGHNPEPLCPSIFPYGLDLGSWTVFRFRAPPYYKGGIAYPFYWVTLYDEYGLISCRPFSYENVVTIPVLEPISSDIASVTVTPPLGKVVVICGNTYTYPEILSRIK